MRLVDHIGAVYRRLETAADPDFDGLAAVRLAVLVHEEPPASLPRLLAWAGLSDYEETVRGVIGGFGAVWKGHPVVGLARLDITHSIREER